MSHSSCFHSSLPSPVWVSRGFRNAPIPTLSILCQEGQPGPLPTILLCPWFSKFGDYLRTLAGPEGADSSCGEGVPRQHRSTDAWDDVTEQKLLCVSRIHRGTHSGLPDSLAALLCAEWRQFRLWSERLQQCAQSSCLWPSVSPPYCNVPRTFHCPPECTCPQAVLSLPRAPGSTNLAVTAAFDERMASFTYFVCIRLGWRRLTAAAQDESESVE